VQRKQVRRQLVSLTHGTFAERNEACERLVARQLHQQLVLCLTQTNQLREKQLVFHGVHVDGEQARLECCTESIAFLRQQQLQLLLQINCRKSFTEKSHLIEKCGKKIKTAGSSNISVKPEINSRIPKKFSHTEDLIFTSTMSCSIWYISSEC